MIVKKTLVHNSNDSKAHVFLENFASSSKVLFNAFELIKEPAIS